MRRPVTGAALVSAAVSAVALFGAGWLAAEPALRWVIPPDVDAMVVVGSPSEVLFEYLKAAIAFALPVALGLVLAGVHGWRRGHPSGPKLLAAYAIPLVAGSIGVIGARIALMRLLAHDLFAMADAGSLTPWIDLASLGQWSWGIATCVLLAGILTAVAATRKRAVS
jgi:hypothetical protein